MNKTTKVAHRQSSQPAATAAMPRSSLRALRRKLLPASLSLLSLFAGSLFLNGEALAAGPAISPATSPTGGSVVGGVGSITQNGANTVINQASQRLALNWQSFNVGTDASVLFNQPGTHAVALNRILDQSPSQIFGHISSNGQVFLINTHGIIFGSTAKLNVGGLVASTLDLTPTDFLANRYNLSANGNVAGIVNHGTIEAASGGSVSLIGGDVSNDGVILANYGRINLDGADRAVLDFDGDGLINVQVTGALQNRLDAGEAAVANKGKLDADGGTVVLQASAAKDLFTDLVNNSGTIQAGGISTDGGIVQLIASGGNTVNSGNIDASGVHGGSVQLLSDRNVGVSGSIDASGTLGGGSIRVGGGARGGEGLLAAANTTVKAGTTLDADATQSGNGGSVVVWGNDNADIAGSLSARGGAQGGDGGAVETSAAQVHIDDSASVSTFAPHGQSGDWLIDPKDFTIAASGGDMTGAALGSGLASGNVTIESSNGSKNGSGDINVDDAVNWNTNTLTLTAADNVNINAVMTASGTAGLALIAATANGSDGAVSGGTVNAMPGSGRVDFTGSGNSLSINGHSYTLLSSASALQGIGDAGYYAVATNIDAGGISNFSPIGQDIFSGTLEGLGHTISNLNIDSTAGVAGLFAFMSGEVANLGLVDGHVMVGASTSGVGELAGVNEGVIRNVYATGTVTATGNDASVGGLVGDNESSILNAYAAVAVTGSGAGSMVGGLVGINDGFHSNNSAPIVNAYATGAVTGSSTGSAGGLVGFNQEGQIQNTYATGAVSGSSGGGGLVGGGSGTVVDSYWDTQTTGQSTSAGGVGETTAQLQANLPSGFSTSTWALVPGKSYPYLLRQFMPGVTPVAVSGTVFTDAGTTAAGAGVAVNAQSGGNALGTTATYANGYFYYLFDPSTLVGGNLLVYAKNYGSGGATNGAAFADGYGTLPALGIFGNAFHVQTGAMQWSTVLADLAGAEGSGATAATALAHLPASGLANLVLGGQGAFNFDSALDWNAGNLDVTAGGNLTQSARLNVAGTSSFDAGSHAITLTNAGNDFQGAVTLTGGATQIADANALTLGTLDTGALTATSGGGLNLGQGVINGDLNIMANGGISQTGSLTVNGVSTFTQDSTVAGLSQDIDLGDFTNAFNGDVNFIAGPGAQIRNLSLRDSATPGILTLPASITGDLTLDLARALAMSGKTVGGALNVTAAGGITLNGNMSTGGAQTWHSAVTLAGDTTLTSTGNGAIDFAGSVNGAHALAVNTGGATSFGGAVGAGTALTSLTTDAAGRTTLGGNVTTSGAQTYDDAVSLSGNATLSSSGNGAIDFGSTVDGSYNLSVSTGGATSFGGAVGANTALASLTTNAAGRTTLGGNVNTSGAQTYNNAVTLGGDAALGSSGNGAINFLSTVDGAHSLSVNTGGLTTFGGAVGGAMALTSLSTDTSGSTALGGNVTTSGAQTYGDAVSLSGNATLGSSGNGAIDFVSTVNGAHSLDIDTSGLITFGGAVGNTMALTSLVSTGSTTLNASVATSGAQTYTGAVTLGGNVTLSSSGNGAIDFVSTVDGAHSLSVNTGGLTTFGGAVGGTNALASLSTAASGGTTLGGSVTTSGGQTYVDAVSLVGNTMLSSSGNGAIGFGSTVDGPYNLGVNTGGAVTFGGAVGSLGQLLGLVVNGGTFSAQALSVQGPLSVSTASGGISQGGAFTVSGDASFSASNGAIALNNGGNSFGGTVSLSNSGANNVSLNDASALTLGNVSVGRGTFTLAGAGISQSAGSAITQASGAGAVVLNGGSGAVALGNNGNDFVGSVSASGGSVSLTDNNALAVGNIQAGSGTVTLVAAGNLDEAAGGVISTSGSLTGSSGGNTSLAGANRVGSLGSFSSGGDFSFNDAQSLLVTTAPVANGGAGNITLSTTGAGSSLTLATGLTGNMVTLDSDSDIVQTAGTINANALAADGASFGANALNIGAGGLDVTTSGGAISQSGAFSVTGASSLDAGAGDIKLSNVGNDFGGTVTATGGNVTLRDINALTAILAAGGSGDLTAGGTLTVSGSTGGNLTTHAGTTSFGALTVGGNLSATAGGAITQVGALGITGNSLLDAGTNAITLSNMGNDFTGTVTATGGNVTLRDVNALNAILAAGGSGNLTAGGTLTVSGSTGGNLAIDAGATSFGATTVGGNLSATAGGAITQTGALGITGTSLLDAGTNAITLSDGGNSFGGAVSLSNSGANNVSVSDSSALTLGNVDVGSGTLTLSGAGISQTAGSAITQSASAGAVTLDGGSGALTLVNTGNDFTGSVSATGSGVSLHDANDLTIASLTDNGGAVNLVADGTLSLPAGGIDADSDDLTLAANGGSLLTPGVLRGGNVSLSGRDGVTLNDDVTASGTLHLASSAGSILQVAGIVTAGTLTGSSSGATTLTGANAIGTLGSFTAAGFNLADMQALTVSGPVDGGSSTTLTTSGDLMIDGAVSGTTTALMSAGAISEGIDGAITAGTLTGNSAGSTTLGGANHVDTLGAFTTGGDFSFNDAQTLTVGQPLVADGGAGDITLTTSGAGSDLILASDLTGATLMLGAGRNISQSGGILTAATLQGHSTGSTTLTGANAIGTLGGFTAAGFNLTDTQALTVSGPVDGGSSTTLTTTNGDLTINGAVKGTTTTLTSVGAIGEGGSGAIIADTLTGSSTGSTALTGANVIGTLGGFTSAGFNLIDTQALTVSGPVDGGSSTTLTTTSGDLTINDVVKGTTTTLTSAGAIGEGGSGAITANTLIGSSSGAATLTGANVIGTLGGFTAAGFNLTDAQALTVSGPVDGGSSTTLTTTSGDLTINGAVSGTTTTLTSVGAISEGGSGTITAGTLTGSSSGATTLTGANVIGTLGGFTATGFNLTDAQALTVSGPVDGGSSTTLTTTNGDLTINGVVKGATTTLTSVGAISEGGSGAITANTLTGSSSGATTLTGANAIDTLGRFTAAGFNLTDTQALTVSGPVDGGNSTTLTTTNGDLTINGAVKGATTTLTSAGAIGEGGSGAITAGTLTGSSSGATTLTGANVIGTLGRFTAIGFNLTDAQALTVSGPVDGGSSTTLTTTNGDLTINGAVKGATTTLTSAGAIGEGGSGAITAGTLTGSSSGATTLTGANAIGMLGGFTAIGFNLTDTQALTVSGPVDGGSSMTLTTTSGDLMINGAVSGTTTMLTSVGAINEGGSGTITADTLTGSSAGSTTLMGANAISTLDGFTSTGFSLTDAQALTVSGPVDGGNSTTLTTTSGDLTINGAVKGATTTLTSAGAIGEGGSGTITAGTLTGSSSGATTLTGANAIGTLGRFTAAGFNLTDTQALTVSGPVTTNGGTGAITLITTAGDLTVDTALSGGAISLTSAGDLGLSHSISGTMVALASGGAIDQTAGVITAGTLTGHSAGDTTLIGANQVGTLGAFTTGGDFSFNDARTLTVDEAPSVHGGAGNITLTTSGSSSDLILASDLTGATVTLGAGRNINQTAGRIKAAMLTGQSTGSTALTGANVIGMLGGFTSAGFNLTDTQALTVSGPVDGGNSTTLTTTNGDLTINGAVKGATTTLTSAGAINEGGSGTITASTLTGSAAGSATLTGANAIGTLGRFTAASFNLTDTQALTVSGPVDGGSSTVLTTTNGDLTINGAVNGATTTLTSAGAINEGGSGAITAGMLTGSSSGAATLTGANAIGTLGRFTAAGFNLTDAQALTVSGPVDGGSSMTLTTMSGDLTINGAVKGTTTTLTSAGAINEGSDGAIAASTLSGSAVSATMLGSATQHNANHVSVLGDFTSLAGFSLTNDQTLTLSSVNGSAFTVNAGTSPIYLAVTGGDLLEFGTDWLYDGVGTWSSTGRIGTASSPIYVTGVSNQTVAEVGLPPAYFYAVDSQGNFLPLLGEPSVNVPTSLLAGHAQNSNHGDTYVDASVVTANYRSFGIVPSGILLPPDQQDCQPGQPNSDDCKDQDQ
ncbi:MAG TPA: filamentous hemagglutinin N-terminal domain-containing protein [Rhodanobacter sp.]